jgi:hypothetical protein
MKIDLTCFNWVKCVMKDDSLPSPARHLALYYSTFMNMNQDVAWPSLNRIMSETGYTKPTVIKHNEILSEKGWLKIEPGGPEKTNKYQISFPSKVEEVVKEINHYPNRVVKEINQGGKGDLPGVVKEVYPNNNSNNNLNNNKRICASADARFPDFWSAWPKGYKKAKPKCLQIWKRKKLDGKADALIADVSDRLGRDENWRQGYIPNPSTYLNQERWNDDVTPPKGGHMSGTLPMPDMPESPIDALSKMRENSVLWSTDYD